MRLVAWREVGGILALAVTAFLATGGAATDMRGLWLGWPGAAWAAGITALSLAAILGRRTSAAASVANGLWVAPTLTLLAAFLLWLRSFTGAALGAVLAAGLVAVLVKARPRWARTALLPTIAVVYGLAALNVQTRVGPQGDEPHYLMVCESLLRDHDVSLADDYAAGRYRTFHPAPLEPHFWVRGKQGEVYSVHAIGLSLLVLPAYALGGYEGASLFMALLAVLLVGEIRGVLEALRLREDVSTGVSWLVALSPPLVHYVGLIFTEVVAALIVAFVVRSFATKDGQSRSHLLAAAVAVALLPWLHVRYAIVALVLGLFAVAVRPNLRTAGWMGGVGAAAAIALAAYHQHLYGFWNPARVFGRRPELAWGRLGEGLPGLLMDQEFGLLCYAPFYALACFGAWRLWRREPRVAATGAALVIALLLMAGMWPMWRGGFNPPARFLVPLVPVLAAGVAARLERGAGAGAVLLCGWSLWTGLVGAARPELIHRDRDGTAPFFRAMSGGLEWTSLLPRYVLSEPDRGSLAAIWALALIAAAWPRRGAVSGRSLAAALCGAGLVAGIAASVTTARPGGRDSVRVVGKAALLVGARPMLQRAADGCWNAALLYEPFRHPDGAVIAERLPLAHGSYRVVLNRLEVGGPPNPPELRVQPEPPSAVRRTPFVVSAETATSDFAVVAGERAVTLSIGGGSAFVLQTVCLSRSTNTGSDGLMP